MSSQDFSGPSSGTAVTSAPRLQHVRHAYMPQYAFPAFPEDVKPVSEAADTRTSDHVEQSRLARSWSRLADSVSGQLFRTGAAAPPTTTPTSASDVCHPIAESRTSVGRADVVPAAVQRTFLDRCPSRPPSPPFEGVYARTYYTGLVKAASDDARGQTEVDSTCGCAPLILHDSSGFLVSVLYGVLPCGCACPRVPYEAPSTQSAASTTSPSLVIGRDARRTRLRFPYLTMELVVAASDGACTADTLLQPPPPPPQPQEASQVCGEEVAVERVVPLWLCTYRGGFCDGRRHGLGTLSVYGEFTLTCLWDADAPLVKPLPSPVAREQPHPPLPPHSSSTPSTACCVLQEHLVVVHADDTGVSGNSPVRAEWRTGDAYMGSLALLPLCELDQGPLPRRGIETAATTSIVEVTPFFQGFRWLQQTYFVPHGFGELRRRGRGWDGSGNKNAAEDDDDQHDQGVMPVRAGDTKETRGPVLPAHAVSGQTGSSAAISAADRPCGRRGRRYLSVSAAPCLTGMAGGAGATEGVRIDVEWYCGGWESGRRHGFGVLVGAASTYTSSSAHATALPAQRHAGGRRGLLETREPCTYIGRFCQQRRCGPGTLEMDRTGMLICGTWGEDGALQPRVPHTLLYRGEPPISLQGLILQSGAPGQSAEGQVWAAAAAFRGREEDVSAPLFFDQATLVQSMGAVKGTWEPLLVDLDNRLGAFSLTLQQERAPLSPIRTGGGTTTGRPLHQMNAILARLADTSEWGAVLAGFQQCFAALYAPCAGVVLAETEVNVALSGGEHNEAAPESDVDTLAFLIAQSASSADVRERVTYRGFSWCQEVLSAQQRRSTTAFQATRHAQSCIHMPSSSSTPFTVPGRQSSRPLIRYRESTAPVLFRHAMERLSALVMSLRLRALPLLADRPWAAELLAASTTTHTGKSAATSGTSIPTSDGVELADALAAFCWSEAYTTVAPVLFQLARACVEADVGEARRQLLLTPPATERGCAGGEAMQRPSALAVPTLASMSTDWLSVFNADKLRAWRYEASVLAGTHRCESPSLATLYRAIECCLCLPRSFFVPPDHCSDETLSAGIAADRTTQNSDEENPKMDEEGAYCEAEQSGPAHVLRANTEESPEEESLIQQLSMLCVTTAQRPDSHRAVCSDTAHGPLITWTHAGDEGTASTSGVHAFVAEVVDVLVSVVHHAVSLFPHSIRRQQQWLSYVIVASAKLLLSSQAPHHGPHDACMEKHTPMIPRHAATLDSIGFNPLGLLLQVNAVFLESSFPLPLPELSTLLLRDLMQQQVHARHLGSRGVTESYDSAAASLKVVLHVVLLRMACAVEACVQTVPAVPWPPLSPLRQPSPVPFGASFGVWASHELSAQARFFLSPTAAYVAEMCAPASARALLTHATTLNGSTQITHLNAAVLYEALSRARGTAAYHVIAQIFDQSTEAMSLALCAAGWAGALPRAWKVEENGARAKVKRPPREAGLPRGAVSPAADEKQRAIEAVCNLTKLHEPESLRTAGAEPERRKPAGLAWMPAALAGTLSIPQIASTPDAVATAKAARPFGRVPVTDFMRWLVESIAQSLAVSRVVPPALATANTTPNTYRRFVPSHQIPSDVVATKRRLTSSGDGSTTGVPVGLTDSDAWYVLLLQLFLHAQGWSLSLTISLQTSATPESHSDRTCSAEASVPPITPSALTVGYDVADDAAGTRQSPRCPGAAKTSRPGPVARKHALFSSSSSSTSTSLSSTRSASPPACSPSKKADDKHLTAGLVRKSVPNVSSEGLFSGPEFCLTVTRNGAEHREADGAGMPPSRAPINLQWQVLEQACGVIAHQC